MHDRDDVFFERAKRNSVRGLAISGVVSIPYALINAFLLIGCYTAAEDVKYDTMRLIFNLVNAPFLFITLNFDYHNIANVIIAGILLPIAIVGFGGASYYLGLNNISVLQKSVYKDEENDKEGQK